ncbi:MAG: hypothetical protein MZW92_45530 [Comamonadaceae bacterium]|nr:hypothetical protein [Comamonadaceae bacterium]
MLLFGVRDGRRPRLLAGLTQQRHALAGPARAAGLPVRRARRSTSSGSGRAAARRWRCRPGTSGSSRRDGRPVPLARAVARYLASWICGSAVRWRSRTSPACGAAARCSQLRRWPACWPGRCAVAAASAAPVLARRALRHAADVELARAAAARQARRAPRRQRRQNR